MHKANIVILAAGFGTRLKLITKKIPKALIKIDKQPVLEHQIKLASQYNFKNILIITDYLENQIRNRNREWMKYCVDIRFAHRKAIGTSYALNNISKKVDDNFILLYADIMTNINLDKVFQFHINRKADVTIVGHLSTHPWDSDLLDFDKHYVLKRIYRTKKPGKYYSSSAIFVFNKKILKYINRKSIHDISKNLLPELLKRKLKIKIYLTDEYIKDMGNHDRLKTVRIDYKNNFQGLNQKIPAVFLDRDGTLIEETNLLTQIEKIRISLGSIQAVKQLNRKGILVIIVTNQSVVARGLCSENDLNRINWEIIKLFSDKHAVINALYYCPHHPEKGFPGENKRYKVICTCRKPKIGLVRKAMQDFNIDLGSSWFIGDQTVDIQTAHNAGIKSILILSGYQGLDKKYPIKPNYIKKNILEAANFIISEYK